MIIELQGKHGQSRWTEYDQDRLVTHLDGPQSNPAFNRIISHKFTYFFHTRKKKGLSEFFQSQKSGKAKEVYVDFFPDYGHFIFLIIIESSNFKKVLKNFLNRNRY